MDVEGYLLRKKESNYLNKHSMELDSSPNSSVSLREEILIGKYCKPNFHPKWVKNKGAILVLIWSFLGFSVYNFLAMRESYLKTGEIFAIIAISLPIGGCLADTYIGRYRAIQCGIWTMWGGAILSGFNLVLGQVAVLYRLHAEQWITLTAKLIMGAGFGVFQANIVPFGIDQLVDASSTEISWFIMWYTTSSFICSITILYSGYCTPDYIAVLVIALFLTLAICSDFLFKHWLSQDQMIHNDSVFLILRVLWFTIKNRKMLRNINVAEHGILSSLNIAKQVYAGPFTNNQVEDVKTLLQILLLVAGLDIICSGLPTMIDISYMLVQHLQNWPMDGDLTLLCYKHLSVLCVDYTVVVVAFLAYWTIIHPFFGVCIPKVKITTKLFCSILLYLGGVISLLGIESGAYINQFRQNNTTMKCAYQHENDRLNVDFHWIIIPNTLFGLSAFLLFSSSLEFICAQAPLTMKGLVFGILFAIYGTGSLIHEALSIPFVKSNIDVWEKVPLTCGLWYFMMQGTITIVSSLVVFTIIKTYKRKERVNDNNMLSQSYNWRKSSS